MSGHSTYGRRYSSATSCKRRRGLFIRMIEAAIVAAFFVFVLSARLYFWLLHKTEKLRWRVMLTMPIRNGRKR